MRALCKSNADGERPILCDLSDRWDLEKLNSRGHREVEWRLPGAGRKGGVKQCRSKGTDFSYKINTF